MSRRRQRLGQQERQAQLLALLRREGTVRIATLANVFDVTTETARRDLDELAAAGALKRTYGGGASRSLIDEPGIGIRNRARAAERGLIASAAARMVESGDALMIDCGSTTSVFANVLAARNLHLTVLTNCLPVAHALSTNAHCRVILCPGDYIAREVGTFGTDTIEFVAKFKADKAFIGAGGLGHDGVTDADSMGCSVKRAMMQRADRTILLLDSSKYDRMHFERICELADIDTLVSEAAPPKKLAASLKLAGVQVAVAKA
jgi:DeoR/GlpR family transcriptional regulator of sugar metabolism